MLRRLAPAVMVPMVGRRLQGGAGDEDGTASRPLGDHVAGRREGPEGEDEQK
jgi:hypothetical protein